MFTYKFSCRAIPLGISLVLPPILMGLITCSPYINMTKIVLKKGISLSTSTYVILKSLGKS